jgi:endonuclease/exonuclease/phosphatase family metal-dependent hydrolase
MHEDNFELIRELMQFSSMGELRRSPVYRRRKPLLDQILKQPRVFEHSGCQPRLESFLRVVQWNIEYGKELDGIVQALDQHPVLRSADLMLINEVDDGMTRSGNLSIAGELSRRLGAHALFGVEYIELAEVSRAAAANGSNNGACLHGSAILTRHPFSNPRVPRLPRCENNFRSAQKRLGGRAGVIADIDLTDSGLTAGRLTAATAHLDVVNSPRCRQAQMRALLSSIDSTQSSGKTSPVLVGGDFNTHTFARGGKLRTAINLGRILLTGGEKLTAELLSPNEREPLLAEFSSFRYQMDGFNDKTPTQTTSAEELGADGSLPGPLRKWALKRLGSPDYKFEFRLDWFAGRGLTALSDGQVVDAKTGVPSASPSTISDLRYQGRRLSDHDPIVVDIGL